MANPNDNPLAPTLICPGEGRFTRNPGIVWGTDPQQMPKGTTPAKQPGPVQSDKADVKSIWEWQWAQTAMYAYYFADFMLAHPTNGFALSEAQYAYLLTGLDAADAFLERLSLEFRRDYARGGRMRPDILGFSIELKTYGAEVLVELLEVTTRSQMTQTFKEDVLYKLTKLKDILGSRQFDIKQTFSATRLLFNIGPSKWKPQRLWQRVVLLPFRTDEKGQTFVEWICFQPTFNQNNGLGIDGLLLYEIHSLPLKLAQTQFQELVNRIREMERRQRQQQQVAYGVTLTPWLTTKYLNQNLLDRDQMFMLAVASGVGLLACLGIIALPAVAGVSMAELMALGGLAARGAAPRIILSSATMLQLGRSLQGTMQTAAQWMNALGRQIVQP